MPLPAQARMLTALTLALGVFALQAGAEGLDRPAMGGPVAVRYDTKTGLAFLQRAAAAGEPEAEFLLGELTEKGDGVPKDPARALELYRASADQGFPEALNDMGVLYFNGGLGLAKDQAKAIGYFRQAADMRLPSAMFNYASFIDAGLVNGAGPKDAARYLFQALRAGSDEVLGALTGQSDALSVKTRTELQKLLKEQGFYSGKVDGHFTQGTLDAIHKAYGPGTVSSNP